MSEQNYFNVHPVEGVVREQERDARRTEIIEEEGLTDESECD